MNSGNEEKLENKSNLRIQHHFFHDFWERSQNFIVFLSLSLCERDGDSPGMWDSEVAVEFTESHEGFADFMEG